MALAACSQNLATHYALVAEARAFIQDKEEGRALATRAGFPEIQIEENAPVSVGPIYCDRIKNCIVFAVSGFQIKNNRLLPNLIQSIFFEMGNLARKQEFDSLIGRIKELTPNEFVEQYEAIEYGSALETKTFLRKYIEIEDWVKYPFAFVSELFGFHYFIQQAGGHSERIWSRHASAFEEGFMYKGKVAPVSDMERRFVFALLDLQLRKNDAEPSIREPAEKDYSRLKDHLLKGPVQGMDLSSRVSEIETVFSCV